MMMLTILVVFPLVIAGFLSLITGKVSKYIALLAGLATFVIALYLFVQPAQVQTINWFNFGSLAFNITTTTAPLNMLLLMLVSIITPLILLYSIGFMDVPSEQPRFYFEMCIFAAAMVLFSISASFITMFIAWEMLGITSYLLISFWYWKEHAPTAGRKAITTILIGDIAMLIAILLIGISYNSFDFAVVLAAPPTIYLPIAMSLILIAVFTKSAQFPFHEWLSDAMEGPTPVSAFLHSSTMVKAGVFLVAVLLPLFVQANLSNVILVIGIVSALIGASNALTERHIKKILAYSTIEDLGLMLIALGLNALLAAVMLFFVQTFYKALLFMGAGNMMRANDEKEDIYQVHGASLNRYLFIALLFGVVSIAGIFPLGGFFGKSAVEASASSNLPVYVLLVVIELATSLYIFRWLFVTMRRTYEENGALKIKYKALPKTMLAPMYVLAALVAVGVLFYNSLLTSFSSSIQNPFALTNIVELAVINVVALAGLGIAFWMYRMGNRQHLASTNRALYTILYNSVVTNKVYLYITKAFAAIASGFGHLDYAFDKSTYAFTQAFIDSGNVVRRIVSGQTNTYVLVFVIGIVLLLIAVVIL